MKNKIIKKKGTSTIVALLLITTTIASTAIYVFGEMGAKSKIAGSKVSNIIEGGEDVSPGWGSGGDGGGNAVIPDIPEIEEVIVPESEENVDPSVDGYVFNTTTKTITKYTGTNKNVVIPKSFLINGVTYDVLNIGIRAFENTGLTSLVIPSQIKTLGNDAFKGNTFTGKVIIDANITTAYRAFGGAVIGENLALSDNVTKIPSGMYLNAGLTKLSIPSSVTSIEASAFMTNKLVSVSIPSSVKVYGQDIFEGNLISEFIVPEHMVAVPVGLMKNNKIRKLVIPETVKTIGNNAFEGNPLDIQVLFNTNLSSSSYALATAPFTGASMGNSLLITDKVTSIPAYIFTNAGISSFILPSSVKNVGNYAFTKNKLKEAPMSSHVTTWGTGVYSENIIESFTIPTYMTKVPHWFLARNNIKKLIVPSHVESLGSFSFLNNNFVEGVVINSNLPGNTLDNTQQIGVAGSPIASLEFGSNVTRVPGGLFAGATFSGVVYLPSGIKTIGNSAFYSAKNLNTVSFDNAIGSVQLYPQAFGNTNPQFIYLK